MYSPSRAEIGESGFSRYDVPVPPSSASSLSGGRREAGRQAFQQGGGCLGFPLFFCWRLLGLIPGGAPFSQLSSGVKDAMVVFTRLVKCQFMTKTCRKAG